MKDIFHPERATIITVVLMLVLSSVLQAQEAYPYYYRIYFTDKGIIDLNSINPEQLLSERAINRRQEAGIPYLQQSDLPVWKEYLDEIASAGYKLHCTSKWMNTAVFRTQSPVNTGALLQLPFVKDVKPVKVPGLKKSFADKLDFEIIREDPLSFERPVTMVNGSVLHNAGFNGMGVLIAVLDGGFTNADNVASLGNLRSRNGIIATRDFVKKGTFVYNDNIHGTAVLSILAGNLSGLIKGTAPAADFILLKTEDTYSEFPCEEDFWATGAEYADSAGADIITSSLGYYYFDDPSMNYKISDLDGNTAFVTKAADFAASKGILVVNSAGNERTGQWKKIIFPSDGDSVLAVGAGDGINLISSFSSAGPSVDRRIKPDNGAMGVAVPVNTSGGRVDRSNGTSFSCPVLSGMAACLKQAVPEATANDLLEAIHASADRYSYPDSLYGYGIPDMGKALAALQDKYMIVPDDEIVVVPNPSSGEIRLIFRESPGPVSLEIITLTGKIILRKDMPGFSGREILISGLQSREQGLYLIRIKKEEGTLVKKIIRIRE